MYRERERGIHRCIGTPWFSCHRPGRAGNSASGLGLHCQVSERTELWLFACPLAGKQLLEICSGRFSLSNIVLQSKTFSCLGRAFKALQVCRDGEGGLHRCVCVCAGSLAAHGALVLGSKGCSAIPVFGLQPAHPCSERNGMSRYSQVHMYMLSSPPQKGIPFPAILHKAVCCSDGIQVPFPGRSASVL